jgi:hypothetical protein
MISQQIATLFKIETKAVIIKTARLTKIGDKNENSSSKFVL